MKSKKVLVFFGLATIFVFGLLFPNLHPVAAINYTTACGETFPIGSCWGVECAICCSGSGEDVVCVPCCPCCTQCSCSANWDEFNANTSGGGPNIQTKECESVCGPAAECCSCGPCQAECTAPEICKQCGSWQKAVRSCTATSWGLNIPDCKCSTSHIDVPTSPRYYDNPDYPTDACNPEPSKDSDNILLPVKLDWDDVKGWQGGWKEGSTCPKNCSDTCPTGCFYPTECYEEPECVHSYVIRIEGEEILLEDGATTTSYTEVLDKSEFIPHNSCFFKSGQTYTWHVKACCDTEGKSCGKENTWTFKTNRAPEPIYPYDPDWKGLKKIEGLNKEESETLQWCKMEDSDLYQEIIVEDEKVYRPLSYKVLIYYSEEDLCHEQLELNGQCIPMVLSPETIPVSRESLPPEEFLDDGSFFTKETAYAWRVAACVDDDGQECSDYSQLWRLGTGSWSLGITLVNPPNDKEIPVGLPVTLRWNSLSANSYNYKLYGVASDKNKTANVVFDYPGLSLNTVYKWTVQACWDYESKECENVWGEPWYFKTTGGPPQLIYPLGNDIPIPINFKWEEVPGAKSYVFKIQGGDLNLERTTEENNFSLDYPDLKQEIDYTWQVKTCARANGAVCGSYSSAKTFKTFRLSSPQNPAPEDKGQIFTYQKNPVLYWQKVEGGKFYQYEVSLVSVSPDETAEDCATGELVAPKTTDFTNSTPLDLTCLGNYEWKVKACLDEACQEAGDWSTYSFSFVKKDEPSGTGGIVPCGRTDDDPDTSWNEKETCQIKHVFLLIRNIIDFVLWTLGPIMLAILVLATGVIFYISISSQNPMPLAKVKSLWKAAGIGYGIIFLSWTILNLFLGLVGFQIGIFGNWWQVGF